MHKQAIFVFLFLTIMISSNGQEVTLPRMTFDSLSVINHNNTWRCIVGWEPYDTVPFDFIRIYTPTTGGYIPYEDLYDTTATYFIDPESDPANKNHSYAIAAFRLSDEARSPIEGPYINEGIHVRNLKINISGYDTCDQAVYLNWNSYYFNIDNPDEHVTYNPPYLITAKSQNDLKQKTVNDTTCSISGLLAGERYEFTVHIKIQDTSSTSAPVYKTIEQPVSPEYIKIERIETSSSFGNTIWFDKDESIPNGGIIALYSESITGPFDTASIIQPGDPTRSIQHYPGTSQKVFYTLQLLNTCGDVVSQSDTLNTIILQGQDETNYIHLWANSIENKPANYAIWRTTDGQPSTIPVTAPIEYYDSEVFNLTLESPRVSYFIEANIGDSVIINSNPVNFIIEDDLLWPNTIIVGTRDGIFKAVAQRSKPTEFHLKIFNKWGQVIAEKNSIDNGWDGTYQGKYVMPGAYLYVATYRFDNKPIKKVKGTVTVIH